MKKILLLLSVFALFACSEKESPVLSIEGGKVQGVSTDIKGVTVYRGIPYAAPPIGDLRWKEPQPVVAWDGVKVCDSFEHPSYQAVHYPGRYTTEWGYGKESPYSEDCLYLNVWTKAPGKTDKKMPVALWIHGGGYREGWGTEPEFDGQEFANKDVVLVTINYRLGVFGFLTHPELTAESPHGVSGNYGVMDMIASLKWIKNNIAQFGGDPNQITIFGQSAGADAVKTLCESPLTAGLIKGAVIMSGGGISKAPKSNPDPMFTPLSFEQSQIRNKEILDWAGFDSLEKMRRASTETIYALNTLYSAVTKQRAYMTAAPVIENYVCTDTFDSAAYGDKLPKIPYMIGYTLNDMGTDALAVEITEFCLNRESVGGKAWAYEFARPLPTDGRGGNILKGAFHSSDLWFVFKSLKHCWRPWTDGDWDLSEKMLTAWTNFVKFGDPNGANGGIWTPLTKDNQKFMLFKLDANDVENSEMGAFLRP